MNEWDLLTSEQYLRDIKKLIKRYPRETRKRSPTWWPISRSFPRIATHCLW